MPAPSDHIDTRALLELAAIKGQLDMMLRLLQEQHSATHRRIDDLGAAMNQRIDTMSAGIDSRFDTLDERVAKLEANERATAIKTAAAAALSGLLGAAGVKFLGN